MQSVKFDTIGIIGLITERNNTMTHNEIVESGQIILVDSRFNHLNRYAVLLRKIDRVNARPWSSLEDWEIEFEDGTRNITKIFIKCG